MLEGCWPCFCAVLFYNFIALIIAFVFHFIALIIAFVFVALLVVFVYIVNSYFKNFIRSLISCRYDYQKFKHYLDWILWLLGLSVYWYRISCILLDIYMYIGMYHVDTSQIAKYDLIVLVWPLVSIIQSFRDVIENI